MSSRHLALAAALAVLLPVVGSLTASDAQAGQRKYKVLRWEEDWSWIEADPPTESDPFDSMKHVGLGGDWHFTFGGSFRLRLEADDNRTLIAPGGPTPDDDELARLRIFLHGDLSRGDVFRWFWEVRYSDTLSGDRSVPAIFRDDPDVQNFFVEFTAASQTDHPVTFRIGRQELLFGAQRLVSPLDWSSTRRTFDGISITFETPRTKTVAFGTHPVMHEIHDIDSPNEDVVFSGVHATFRPAQRHRIDGYVYIKHDSRDTYKSELDPTDLGDMTSRTWGVRYVYDPGNWWLDTEWAYQEGQVSSDDIEAFMGSLTAGYRWRNCSWKPALSVGLDVATGDGDPMDGDVETFDQLFPLGHAFFGHIDLVGRRNIQAARLQLDLKPRPNVKWSTSIHRFELDETADSLYNAGGAAIRTDLLGTARDTVATELDTMVKWSFATHHSVAAEFVKWWSDDFITDTGDGRDAWFAWVAYSFTF